MRIIDIGGIRIGLTGLDPGLDVAVQSRYARFLVEAAPDFTLAISVAGDEAHAPPEIPHVERDAPRRYTIDYGALQATLDLEARRGTATVLSTVYIVDSLLRITTTLLALERGALLVHSSGVRVGDKILVCFGPSGVGKTTVARSVDRRDVLCDEMMLVSPRDGGAAVASATPFHGDLSWCQPGAGELLALVRLKQEPADRWIALSPAQAAQALLGAVLFFCQDAELAEKLLGCALRICGGKTYSLGFRRETHVPTFVVDHLGRDASQAGAKAAGP